MNGSAHLTGKGSEPDPSGKQVFPATSPCHTGATQSAGCQGPALPGAPAYLESTNPASSQRYMNAGFEPRGEITMATGHIVTAMWRPAR